MGILPGRYESSPTRRGIYERSPDESRSRRSEVVFGGLIIFLLDTDISSYYIKGGYPALDDKLRYAEPGTVFVSAITLAELLFGLKPLPWRHEKRADVARFLKLAQILPWDGPAAEAYADVHYSLIRSGRVIGEMDMMIAAHAISSGKTLISNNIRHYKRIVPPLKLENWTQA